MIAITHVLYHRTVLYNYTVVNISGGGGGGGGTTTTITTSNRTGGVAGRS